MTKHSHNWKNNPANFAQFGIGHNAFVYTRDCVDCNARGFVRLPSDTRIDGLTANEVVQLGTNHPMRRAKFAVN